MGHVTTGATTSRSADLDQCFSILEGGVLAAAKPQGYFQSEELHQLKAQAFRAYRHLEPIVTDFLQVVRGRSAGEVADTRSLRSAMCFPARFLGVESIDDLDSPAAERTDEILRLALHLGLAYHFSLHNCPARDNHERVDMDLLARWFYPESLVAAARLKEYDTSTGGLPTRVFGWFHRTSAASVLRDVLKLGLWKRAKSKSYLRNLMFSGILMGMGFDMAAQGKL